MIVVFVIDMKFEYNKICFYFLVFRKKMFGFGNYKMYILVVKLLKFYD